ncbi:hypothetical protein DL93DRAFT_2074524 [Clavulina sp. PMI_390]|nr:hypothetical protein DL93DRAFT_2074524 [Clavulina sp. PMI_390]
MFPRIEFVPDHYHEFEFDETWPSPWSRCELSVMGISGGWRYGEPETRSDES